MKKYFLVALALCVTLTGFSGCTEKAPASSSEPESSIAVSSEPSEISSEPESKVSSVVSEVPKEPKKKKEGSLTLSDDIYSFQLQIDGDVYQFPMTFEEFISYGWTYKGDATTEVAPNQYSVSERMFKGDFEIYAMAINYDVNTKPMNECYIGGVTIDSFAIDKVDNVEILLPGGFDCFAATAEDAKALYGTPSYDNATDSGLTTIKYELDSYQEVSMVFDGETKLLYKVDVRNLAAPEDFQSGDVSTETPAVVSKYQAPTAISENFEDFVVELGGDLYQLPAPVSAFEANGWTVLEADSEMTVAGKDSGWVTIMKDNQQVRAISKNYSDSATAINNCFVTRVKGSDSSGEQISIKISKGIEIGTSKADLEAALSGITYESEDSSSYTYYQIMPKDSKLDCYEVYVKSESGEVYKIEASNSPKYDVFVGN